jgi:hypothetical protein
MKKFLIIVFLVVVFSFNFNWVYGQNCQNDISVSSTKACVIDKINQIISKIREVKDSLKGFNYGARYGGGIIYFKIGDFEIGDRGWSEEHLQNILTKFIENKGKINEIKNRVIRKIQDKYKRYVRFCGDIHDLPSKLTLCIINRLLEDDFKINDDRYPFSDFAFDNYGVSIILEDSKSYIFLSITNEEKGKHSKSVTTSVLEFLDKFDLFLTYIESFEKIGDKIKAFGGEREETLCITNLNNIIRKISTTTNLDYIRKVDQNIDAFDKTISESSFLGISFLDTFRLVSQVGIVGAFFGTSSLDVWEDKGGYYQLGVYLKNMERAAKDIKNTANNLEKAYNVYLESCNVKFFENGKTRSGIDAEDLPGKMEEHVRNFFPIITSGYIKVRNVEVPIAVIPPVVWSDEHLGTKTLAAITPERVFNEVRNFVFSLAHFVFTILLLAGALFYLLSPFDVEKIKTGSEYIKWAVFGYFLLLIITSILLALRFIFGGP